MKYISSILLNDVELKLCEKLAIEKYNESRKTSRVDTNMTTDTLYPDITGLQAELAVNNYFNSNGIINKFLPEVNVANPHKTPDLLGLFQIKYRSNKVEVDISKKNAQWEHPYIFCTPTDAYGEIKIVGWAWTSEIVKNGSYYDKYEKYKYPWDLLRRIDLVRVYNVLKGKNWKTRKIK